MATDLEKKKQNRSKQSDILSPFRVKLFQEYEKNKVYYQRPGPLDFKHHPRDPGLSYT